jgi:predicted GNAT family acetyltransferase
MLKTFGTEFTIVTSAVHDNPDRHRFELDVDGVTAFTVYRHKAGVVTFIHTEVPEALEGRGVGSKLAQGALEIVRSRGEKVVAECPFIAGYIKKHPEFQDLLKD